MTAVWTLTLVALAVDTIRNQRLGYLNPARERSDLYAGAFMLIAGAIGPIILAIIVFNSWLLGDAGREVFGRAVVYGIGGLILFVAWLFQSAILVLLPFAVTTNAWASLAHSLLSGDDIVAPVLAWLYGEIFGDGGELLLHLWKLAVALFGTVVLVRLGLRAE
mgnify:FL=1